MLHFSHSNNSLKQEKEETIESLKRSHQKELEAFRMQMSDIETRYKGENVKIKKKAEIELGEAQQQINQVSAAKGKQRSFGWNYPY